MTEQKKDNRGYLYPNSEKTKPTQPDMTGKATVKSIEQRMAAWENVSPQGKKYLSIIFSDPLPENTNTNNTNSTSSNKTQDTSNHQNTTAAPISDEYDDLDAILRSTDDENPFN